MSKSNPIKRIFDLYISDLSYSEIERLIKKESSDVYEYFANDIPKPDKRKNKFLRALIFLRSLFNAFILKLSPARRIMYILAIILFAIGVMNVNNSYVFVGFAIMNVLLAFELADKLSFKNELDLAHNIQKQLLPEEDINPEGYNVASYYEAAKEVGGDYYDIIKVSENKHLFLVGDISGKGLPAALHMVRLQTIIQLLVNESVTPKEVFVKLNSVFTNRFSKGYFVTLISVCIDGYNKIKFCRAGHPAAFYYSKEKEEVEEIKPKGIGVGLQSGSVFEENLEEYEVKPSSGDVIVLFSDGITEAMNEHKDQFGTKMIEKIVRKYSGETAEVIKQRIITNLNFFRGDAPRNDDITLLVIKAE